MMELGIVIDGKQRNYSGPAKWDELKNARMYQAIFRLSRITAVYSPARFGAIALLFGIPRKIRKYLTTVTDETDPDLLLTIDLLMQETGWIWDEHPRKVFFHQRLKVLWKRFDGPRDSFGEMSFGKFIFADRFFEQLKTSRDYKKTSRLFMAALYCPEEGFHPKKIDELEKWMRLVPADVREAIIYNYAGLRMQLAENFPEVFEPPKAGDKPKADKMATGWLDVAINLAGDDLGKLGEYQKGDLFLVMKVLKNAVVRSKLLEENNPKKRTRS